MFFRRAAALAVVAAGLSLGGGVMLAQHSDDKQQQDVPAPVPPPLPPQEPPKDAPEYEPLIPDDGRPWEIPKELLEKLEQKARIYQAVLQSFTCDETVRRAEYSNGGADVSKERVNVYGYLLVKDPYNETVRESRREFDKKGELKDGEVVDEEPFPPAYEWVFLFSEFHQPLFSYRHVGQHFDGFDVVHEIEFKGALPFTNGRDIRQWEGRVLVDAFTFTPLEVYAEPTGQQDRIRQMFDQYNRSFNVLGMRTGKKPLGYKAKVEFGFRKELGTTRTVRLTFPTQLRYDTQKAVSPRQIEPVRASTRSYTNYKFFTTEVAPEVLGDVAQSQD